MTASEWLAYLDSAPMLKCLRGTGHDRKFRLFATASCRAFLAAYLDEQGRETLDCVERFADGTIGRDRITRARALARTSGSFLGASELSSYAIEHLRTTIWVTAQTSAFGAAWTTSRYVVQAKRMLMGRSDWEGYNTITQQAEATLCSLLREVFGNPFDPHPIVDRWLTPTVTAFSAAVYDTGAFDGLPFLGDALEDAGCTDAVILDHLRGPGPHVRGCWVVDLILGKQ
jgi:hypothetical protein